MSCEFDHPATGHAVEIDSTSRWFAAYGWCEGGEMNVEGELLHASNGSVVDGVTATRLAPAPAWIVKFNLPPAINGQYKIRLTNENGSVLKTSDQFTITIVHVAAPRILYPRTDMTMKRQHFVAYGDHNPDATICPETSNIYLNANALNATKTVIRSPSEWVLQFREVELRNTPGATVKLQVIANPAFNNGEVTLGGLQ